MVVGRLVPLAQFISSFKLLTAHCICFCLYAFIGLIVDVRSYEENNSKMDSDEEISSEDLAFLDVKVQKEIDKCVGSKTQTSEIDSIQNTQFHQMISDCFADCFDDDETEPQMEHVECLRSKFRHSSFREKQWDIIKTLNEKRDVCAVMATGYGKSLCYQFTAVFSKKMTLVVSPLIALMQAQVIGLKKVGISACLVGSAQTNPKILDEIAVGRFAVIYCSPEHLQTSRGNTLLSILRGRLALIAVDEAHVSLFFFGVNLSD